MDNQVPEPVKKERSNELLALAQKMSKEFREDYLGREVTVLLEEPFVFEGETYMTGYTPTYVKVAVKTEENLANQFVTGTLKKCLTEDIYLLQD